MPNALEKLQATVDLKTLAPLLGFKAKAISYILYKSPVDQRYREFKIDKKSGGKRLICAPNDNLLLLQKRLLALLQKCRNVIEAENSVNVKYKIAHGSRKKHSIYTNSVRHKRKRFVCNVDLKDFFPTINFGRVRGYFIKNRSFSLQPRVATVIAQICCHNNLLPQGAPTSGLVAELIAGSLDQRVSKLARSENCSYTRYVDDITLSTNKFCFPKNIATSTEDGPARWKIGDRLKSTIERSGFEVNEDKFRLQFRSGRQVVTGLVVNQKPNINNRFLKSARAMVDHYCRHGYAYKGRPGGVDKEEGKIKPSQLRGMLSFIYWVKGREFNYRRFSDNDKEAEPSVIKMYRQFLDYNSFFDTDVPVILLEGKTDHIYLRAAIRSRGAAFPDLCRKVDKKIILRLKFYRYSKHSLPVQRLGGGCGDIRIFLSQFAKRTSSFSNEGRRGPLIVVVDNDKAAKAVFSVAKDVGGIKDTVDGMADFYKMGNRLYLVAIPKENAGDNVSIEDLFPEEVLGTLWRGKRLSLSDNFDEKKFYGKYNFAEQVVRPNESTIDFSGFDRLLARIAAVIRDDAGA